MIVNHVRGSKNNTKIFQKPIIQIVITGRDCVNMRETFA